MEGSPRQPGYGTDTGSVARATANRHKSSTVGILAGTGGMVGLGGILGAVDRSGTTGDCARGSRELGVWPVPFDIVVTYAEVRLRTLPQLLVRGERRFLAG